MKNFLIAFSVFIVWSFFGLWLYSWFDSEENSAMVKTQPIETSIVEPVVNPSEATEKKFNKPDSSSSTNTDTIQDTDTNSEVKEVKPTGLTALSNGLTIFSLSEGISIKKNNADLIIPETIQDFAYKINSYLISHPKMEVHINSFYGASENIQTPNLGVRRGEKIKNMLVDVGVANEKIVVKPTIKEIDFDEHELYKNGISIVFKPLDSNRIEELKTKLTARKTVYPIFSNTGILVNKNLEDLLTEVKHIVQNNPETRIELIGHTDNIGSDIDNYKMGLNYSMQVRWFLVAKGGIKRANIKASSKGESDPVDTNNSERGRIANRRIEIVFY
ncbi:OmpA family protein [Ulvibacter antarcticus]|uniref:OmpA family protein n=1 Tax=Ulvibacter antarcticus TaxID=442714 RepID=A0A3L9YUV4_9FLAO|nr:OmpA family protein [Ulvibacter antarcticus]RMA64446.1 OmpA family protein [Ulvibacter antarcticus]